MAIRSPKSAKSPRSVRVWGEVGITLAVTDNPPQFVKFTFGHERLSPDSTQASIKKTEAQIHAYNEEILERRIKDYRRLIRRTKED